MSTVWLPAPTVRRPDPMAPRSPFHLLAKPAGAIDRVMQGLDHLRAAGVDWNALTTLHDANAGHGREVYAFLRDDCGARHLQFIPIVERTTARHLPAADAGWGVRAKDRPLYRQEGDQVTRRSLTGERYGRFPVDVFEDWVRRDVGTVYVQMFDVALANRYGAPPSLCVHSETCGRALALEHNGDAYSCDRFVEPQYLLGNIGQRHLLELVDSPEQQEFGRHKRESLPRFCRECDVRFACHGGCPKDRFDVTPDGEPGLNHLCPGFKEFFHHVDLPMRTMTALLRQNLPPALIMRQYAAADARRPHNAPCPLRRRAQVGALPRPPPAPHPHRVMCPQADGRSVEQVRPGTAALSRRSTRGGNRGLPPGKLGLPPPQRVHDHALLLPVDHVVRAALPGHRGHLP